MLLDKNKVTRLLAIALISISLLVLAKISDASDSIYSPYPIIFVHGINSKMGVWGYTKSELEKYFKDQSGYKYFHDDEYDYFPYANYGWKNNGDIRDIAFPTLEGQIDIALASFPSEVPEGERKVIIVAHSMGGLVLRSLLKQDLTGYYASKIDRVVFLGTPHLGAPSASALWILKELNIDNNLITKYSKFYSASVFTGFKFKPVNYSPYVFSAVAARLMTLKVNIAILLKAAKAWGPDPNEIALEQLRLTGDVNYHATITDFSLFQFIMEDISHGHSGSETFLAQNNLVNPSNYKIIRGVNNRSGKWLTWGISQLIDNFSNNFTFPVLKGELQSLENAKDIGDGIVTKGSQEGIGAADYVISAFHASVPFIEDEVEAYDTILQAIEDKPVIESAYLVGAVDTYIVIKVKDYLLADIEIAEMTLDGNVIDLSEFYDEQSDSYKPYVKFDKDFLKERYVYLSDEKIHLRPGEFYVAVDMPSDYESHNIYFKFKNPANKETEAVLCLPAERHITKENGASTGTRPDNQDDWIDIRDTAYSNFLNTTKHISNSTYEIGINANILGLYYSIPGAPESGWWWRAYIEETYSSWLNFDLDITGKDIKLAKFIYNFYKHLEGEGQDFTVSILVDSSNAWPPAVDSAADTLLFSLNTNSLPDEEEAALSLQKDIDINLQNINISGNNVWQIKPDPSFSPDNYIPEPAFDDDIGEGTFSQEMKILYYPSLFVTFEEPAE